MRSADIVIVGAGIIGASIAYALARTGGLRIRLIDRGTPGCEASNAAAGVLAVASSRARRGALFELRRLSAAMFPELVAALSDETGIDVGYRSYGLIALAFSAAEAAALADLVGVRHAQALRAEMLDHDQLLQLAPAVNPQVLAGALFPDDRAIDNERLVSALVDAALRRGVALDTRTPVQAIHASDRGVTVSLHDGTVEAETAVVAAGVWSGDVLAACGIKVPVRPLRGEMVAVRPTRWQLTHTLAAGETYLVPRGDEVLIGSTTAAGFDNQATPEGVATLRALAAHLVPATAAEPPVRAWAGLRPCSTIHRPIIARLPGWERVILATGHHRSGILLAPITAKLVAELVTGSAPSVALHPFGYRKR